MDLLPSNIDPQNRNYIEKEEFPLEGALQTAFGGEEFVFTNLFSKAGIQIGQCYYYFYSIISKQILYMEQNRT